MMKTKSDITNSNLRKFLKRMNKRGDEHSRGNGTLVSSKKYIELTKDCRICKSNKENAKAKRFGFMVCPDHNHIRIE